ncbi:MAG: RnfH family protein [Kangiella sp.]|nr:MAG: RnfH family protein [Kangiella sp.]
MNDLIKSQEQKSINIEVIYAKKDEQKLFYLRVNNDTNVESAIRQSGILKHYSEIDLAINKIGIFSTSCKLGDPLHDNDRIEIYRPLIIDPKEARKQRAKKNSSQEKGGS